METLEKLSGLISKYMAALVIVIAGVALYEPASFRWAAPQIALLLGVVMFGMGMTLRMADFKLVFSRPKDEMCIRDRQGQDHAGRRDFAGQLPLLGQRDA